jgi:hypothetical protein
MDIFKLQISIHPIQIHLMSSNVHPEPQPPIETRDVHRARGGGRRRGGCSAASADRPLPNAKFS